MGRRAGLCFLVSSKLARFTLFKPFLQLCADFHSDTILRNWANKTPLLPDPDDTDPQKPIFHKLVTLYHDLASRSQDMIVQLVCTEVEAGMRAYHAATTTR